MDDGGYRFFRFGYLKFLRDSSHVFVHGEILSTPIELNFKTASTLFEEHPLLNEYPGKLGRSIALLVWPGKKRSGGPFVADQYLPETVVDLGSLMTRAQDYEDSRWTAEGLAKTIKAEYPIIVELFDLAAEKGVPVYEPFTGAPHHGSRRNVSPSVLDRIVGPKLPKDAPRTKRAIVSRLA